MTLSDLKVGQPVAIKGDASLPANRVTLNADGSVSLSRAWTADEIAALDRIEATLTGQSMTPEDEQAALEADPDFGVCDRCGGEGFIEYNDGDGGDWGEDSPSEVNHLITCRQCHGTGKS